MNYLSYRKDLFSLSRKKEQERKLLYKAIASAGKKGGRDAEIEVYQTECFDLEKAEEKILILKSRYLISIADKIYLPIPPITDKEGLWKHGRYIQAWFLTEKGFTELRSTIRKEKSERIDYTSRLIGIIIGLIGALTGLIAVAL